MSTAGAWLRDLRDEAAACFVGRGAVVAVGLDGGDGLVVLTATADPDSEAAIRNWARSRAVTVEVHVSGQIRAAVSAHE